MSQQIDDGGTAFPAKYSDHYDDRGKPCGDGGMSLRDWFAGQVDVSVYAPRELFEINHGRAPTAGELVQYVATIRLMEADAMIRARKGGDQ